MDSQILSVFSPMVLIGLGVILIALEAFIYSFFVVWFGIGLIIVGVVSNFYNFSDGMWQLSLTTLIALLLLFTLRAKISEKFLKEQDQAPKEDFLNQSGRGVIKNNKVYFKATYWDIKSDDKFEDGEEVEVVEASKGVALVKKVK